MYTRSLTKLGEKQAPTDIDQYCQMAYFQAKNPDLCKFWRLLEKEDVGIL
jgi:hypothetical protein